MSKSVVVYSQPDCPPCEWTKDFLTRNGIEFTVKDVRADAKAREELLAIGFRSTPVTIIDGTAVAGAVHARAIDNVDLWTGWNDAVYCSNTCGSWVYVTIRVTEYHAFSCNQSYLTSFWVAPYDNVFVGWTGYCGGDIEDVGYCLIRATY